LQCEASWRGLELYYIIFLALGINQGFHDTYGINGSLGSDAHLRWLYADKLKSYDLHLNNYHLLAVNT